MQKSKWLILLCFLLSCSKPIQEGKDGYTFETKQFDRSKVYVNLVLFDSHSELLNEGWKLGIPRVLNRELVAFSRVSLDKNQCTIYLVDPQEEYQPEFLGHELAHCLWGKWHPSQD